jgi:hypothetical protein
MNTEICSVRKPLGFTLMMNSVTALQYQKYFTYLETDEVSWLLTTYMIHETENIMGRCLCTFKKTVHHKNIYITQHYTRYRIHSQAYALHDWHVRILLHHTPVHTLQNVAHSRLGRHLMQLGKQHDTWHMTHDTWCMSWDVSTFLCATSFKTYQCSC